MYVILMPSPPFPKNVEIRYLLYVFLIQKILLMHKIDITRNFLSIT